MQLKWWKFALHACFKVIDLVLGSPSPQRHREEKESSSVSRLMGISGSFSGPACRAVGSVGVLLEGTAKLGTMSE